VTWAAKSNLVLLPRLIRLRDALAYVGMDRNRFQVEVRPTLTEVPIGIEGIAFDRLELDAWADDYIARNGRPGRKGAKTWDANPYQAWCAEAASGTSTNGSRAGAFDKALARIDGTKRK
jgi:hypothetical protein